MFRETQTSLLQQENERISFAVKETGVYPQVSHQQSMLHQLPLGRVQHISQGKLKDQPSEAKAIHSSNDLSLVSAPARLYRVSGIYSLSTKPYKVKNAQVV